MIRDRIEENTPGIDERKIFDDFPENRDLEFQFK